MPFTPSPQMPMTPIRMDGLFPGSSKLTGLSALSMVSCRLEWLAAVRRWMFQRWVQCLSAYNASRIATPGREQNKTTCFLIGPLVPSHDLCQAGSRTPRRARNRLLWPPQESFYFGKLGTSFAQVVNGMRARSLMLDTTLGGQVFRIVCVVRRDPPLPSISDNS